MTTLAPPPEQPPAITAPVEAPVAEKPLPPSGFSAEEWEEYLSETEAPEEAEPAADAPPAEEKPAESAEPAAETPPAEEKPAEAAPAADPGVDMWGNTIGADGIARDSDGNALDFLGLPVISDDDWRAYREEDPEGAAKDYQDYLHAQQSRQTMLVGNFAERATTEETQIRAELAEYGLKPETVEKVVFEARNLLNQTVQKNGVQSLISLSLTTAANAVITSNLREILKEAKGAAPATPAAENPVPPPAAPAPAAAPSAPAVRLAAPGMASASSSGARGGSGGVGVVGLSEEQQAAAVQLGMSPEEFLKYSEEGPID